MDKKIVDKLIQFGLITTIGVDANKYTDVDDLIAKGIITIPGAKAKIMELIGDDSIVIEELPANDDVVDNEAVVDAPTEEDIVVEDVTEDIEPSVVEPEVIEDVEPEVIVETPNKSKKSKKN